MFSLRMERDLRKLNKVQVMDNLSSKLLAVQDSRFGKGTFATQHIPKNTIIVAIEGKKLTFSDSLELGDRESYCLQIGIDKYIIPDVPFRYSNHSCDPNAGINERLELFALRDIPKGEEILWDYSSSMLERHWTMRCACESPYCRRLITDFDLLPIHTQRLYLRLGIVLPFITEYLETKRSELVFVNYR